MEKSAYFSKLGRQGIHISSLFPNKIPADIYDW